MAVHWLMESYYGEPVACVITAEEISDLMEMAVKPGSTDGSGTDNNRDTTELSSSHSRHKETAHVPSQE